MAASFGLTGRQAEAALLESGVVTNRNSIPADPNGAWYTSGIRLEVVPQFVEVRRWSPA